MRRLILLTVLFGVTFAKNSYVIVAPDTLRPGMDFEISANILKATGDVNVKATLKKGTQSIASTSEILKQDAAQSLSLQIPKDITPGSYELEVTGSGGLTFSNKTNIKYNSKSMSIFIQTDKAMYKPGQTVHFRVFGIYPDKKMFTDPMTVKILDPNSNKIKQWIDVQDASGVITNFLSLSDQPVLGDWKIKVTAGTTSTVKTFTISEYVLPKFDVTVELPPYVSTTDTDIKVSVKARYTYGKSVQGTVSLVVKNINRYHTPYPNGVEPLITRSMNIDGEESIQIQITEVDKVWPRRVVDMQFRISATVTETLTGLNITDSDTITVFLHPVKLFFSHGDASNFKPGMKYYGYVIHVNQRSPPNTFAILQLHVMEPDGRPVVQGNTKVTSQTFVTSDIKDTSTHAYLFTRHHTYQLPAKSYTVPVDGIVPLEISIPANASSISITFHYGKSYVNLKIEKSFSPSDSYIQLQHRSQDLAIGDNAVIDIQSTEPVDQLVYQVLGHGSLVSTGTLVMENKTSFSFNIPVTTKMAPIARVIVYYVREDGEIVTDSISFNIDGTFENQVSISMDKSMAKPGESVNVEVTADPSSLVNLLAVDQSVLLLKSGNDVTQSEVLEEINTYNTQDSSAKHHWHYGWGYIGYFFGSDATQTFKRSGVAVMTDALVFKHKPTFYFHHGFFGGGGGGSFTVHHPTEPATLQEVGRVREVFPETWLWTNTTVGSDGKAIISATVPDSMTSWVASAFAVNGKSGLGVAPTTTKIQVFRPFFVSLNLPYSVTRGEQVALQAIVFNYLTQDVDAVVSLPQSQEYQNVFIDSTGRETIDSKDQMQTVHVKAGGAMSVFFPIIPKKLGKIDFTVSARSTLAADAVKRQLLVEPEGTPKEFNVPVLIDLKKVSTFTQSAPLSLPSNIVKDSLRARVTAIGDLMGSSVNGIDHLLRMPTGCGEQTMLGFAPDVFITNYLTATKQLTGDIEDKARDYMNKGYQRELTFQHKDGSFSAFGHRDSSGSMWLTAFVVKTFHQAKPHIFIDEEVITKGINWMLSKQSADGSFPEPGRIIHKAMSGGSGKGTALTAFVVISLLENNDLTKSLKERTHSATVRAVEYLEKQTIKDDYTLAITTYALQLAGSQKTDSLLATLNSHAINKDGQTYWHRPDQKATQTKTYWKQPHSSKAIDIEMTSYALLTYQARKDLNGGLNIMKWIISKRNPNGGFASTQDTVLALQSLSEFAKMAYSSNFDVQVTITAGTFTHHFSINQNNALVLQSVDLPSVPSSVQVQATGSGIALVEVGVFFNVDADVEEPTFDLTYKILEEDINSITLQTCANWLGNGSSGMAIEEVGFPSGFEVDTDLLKQMKTIQKFETENKKVVLYFDEIGTSPVCMTFSLMRTGLVAKSQPVPVRVYDYYEPSNQKTVFFESSVLKNSEICKVCPDCENCT